MLAACARPVGGEPRDAVPAKGCSADGCSAEGAVPANGVDSTPLSTGRVGGDAIGRRLAVDLEFGREGENGGRSPCRRTMPLAAWG